MEVASATAVWYHGDLPPVTIRWVLVRDPQGRFDPQALRCKEQVRLEHGVSHRIHAVCSCHDDDTPASPIM